MSPDVERMQADLEYLKRYDLEVSYEFKEKQVQGFPNGAKLCDSGKQGILTAAYILTTWFQTYYYAFCSNGERVSDQNISSSMNAARMGGIACKDSSSLNEKHCIAIERGGFTLVTERRSSSYSGIDHQGRQVEPDGASSTIWSLAIEVASLQPASFQRNGCIACCVAL